MKCNICGSFNVREVKSNIQKYECLDCNNNSCFSGLIDNKLLVYDYPIAYEIDADKPKL